MKVIPLHQKQKIERRNAAETLSYVLDAVISGDTSPESIIVAWNEPAENDEFHMRYMIGGKTTLASTLGMLDIVKGELLK